jgi:hypothetical protein
LPVKPKPLDKRPHARLYSEWRHLAAWCQLSPLEKIILLETLATFQKSVGNTFRLTAKGISREYKCAQKTARNAIASLEEKGWMDRIGVRPGPTGQIGGVYRMTCLTEFGWPARGRFEQWEPEEES